MFVLLVINLKLKDFIFDNKSDFCLLPFKTVTTGQNLPSGFDLIQSMSSIYFCYFPKKLIGYNKVLKAMLWRFTIITYI